MNKIAKKLRHSYFVERLKGFFFFFLLLNSPQRVYIKATPGKGSGLFANRSFRAGELVFVARGPCRIAHFEGNECYKYPDWYGVDQDTWIDIASPYVKINHSCKPNLGVYSSRCFVALRTIASNEELTFDYSTTDEEPQWLMGTNGPDICVCGEAVCRKFIGPIQSLPQQYINQVYPYLPTYFIKKYHIVRMQAVIEKKSYSQKIAKFTNTQ